MYNYKLQIQYDGGRYDGWQRLGKDSSSNTIEVKIKEIIKKPVIEIGDNYFVILSHISPTNNRLILNKEEASLVLIELMKFLRITEIQDNKSQLIKALRELQDEIDDLKKFHCEMPLVKLLELKQNYLKLINQ